MKKPDYILIVLLLLNLVVVALLIWVVYYLISMPEEFRLMADSLLTDIFD